MSGPGGYELGKVRELGNPIVKKLYSDGIVGRELTLTVGPFSDDRLYEPDPKNGNILVLNVDRLKRFEEQVRDGDRFKKADPDSQREIMDSSIRSYILDATFHYLRSHVAPKPTTDEMIAEEQLKYFITTLCFEYDPGYLIKDIATYSRRNRIDISKLCEEGPNIYERLMKVREPYAALFGMIATLSDRSLEDKRKDAYELMNSPSSKISERLLPLVADGLRKLSKYLPLIKIAEKNEEIPPPVAETQQSTNAAKQSIVILFLTLIGAYFLFPQLPNQITSAFVLLPTQNLLFLNFVVTLLVIVLVYIFTHERESLNY